MTNKQTKDDVMTFQQGRLLSELSIEQIEIEAVRFLCEQCESSSNIGLGFSGGKDSTVIMELMKRTGLKFTAFYHATQIDPPEVMRFIRKHHPEVKFIHPKVPFYKKLLSYAPPLVSARWCCAALKHDSHYTKEFNPIVLGIRSEESFRRRGYSRVDFWRKNQASIYPIFHWTLADVWEYIEFRNLPYCELYDEGYDRLGCTPCPFMQKWQHDRDKKRWPGKYKAFENSVKKWYWRKWWQGYDMEHDSPEDFLTAWYCQKARWYADSSDYVAWRSRQIRQMKRYLFGGDNDHSH